MHILLNILLLYSAVGLFCVPSVEKSFISNLRTMNNNKHLVIIGLGNKKHGPITAKMMEICKCINDIVKYLILFAEIMSNHVISIDYIFSMADRFSPNRTDICTLHNVLSKLAQEFEDAHQHYAVWMVARRVLSISFKQLVLDLDALRDVVEYLIKGNLIIEEILEEFANYGLNAFLTSDKEKLLDLRDNLSQGMEILSQLGYFDDPSCIMADTRIQSKDVDELIETWKCSIEWYQTRINFEHLLSILLLDEKGCKSVSNSSNKAFFPKNYGCIAMADAFFQPFFELPWSGCLLLVIIIPIICFIGYIILKLLHRRTNCARSCSTGTKEKRQDSIE